MQRVLLLGGIEFSSTDAASALLARPKCLALLAWLATHSDLGPRQRGELLRLLWSGKELSFARNSLRQAIFLLRGALGQDAIVGTGDAVALAESRLRCDVVELDRALREGRDEDAVRLYRGDLLHGLVIPRAPEAMEWIAEARRVRRVQVIDAASRLATAAESASDTDAALRWARRAAELMRVEARPSSQLATLIDSDETRTRRHFTSMQVDTHPTSATRDSGGVPASVMRDIRLRVAFLPLLNLSGDAADDAFADSLMEAVAGELGGARSDIERVAHTSTRQLQSCALDSAATGSRLGADAFIAGTMTRADASLSIALHVQRSDGTIVWCDRVTESELAIDRITSRLAAAIHRVLPPPLALVREVRRIRRDGRNQAAVVAVLRGLHHVWRLTPHDLALALSHFTDATRLDPESAPAWAGRGQTLLFLPIYSPVATVHAYPHAIEALDRALALDPGYATAHAARAVAAAVWEWDFSRGDRLVARAHELDPSDHEAWVADLLYVRAPLNRGRAAIEAAQRLVHLDPASPLSLAYASIGTGFFDPEAAETYARDALTLEPSLPTAHWSMAGLSLGRGDTTRALDHADLVVDLTGGDPGFRAMRALYLLLAGERARAELELADVLGAPALPDTGRYYVALTMLHLGDIEDALERLGCELESRNAMAIYLGVDPLLRGLHSDQRFIAMRGRVGV